MISLINTRSHWTDVIEQNHFPDGTLHINMPPNYFDYDTIVWEYENDAELFTLICVKGHFEDFPVNLDMPYIPHARMDRVQELEDVFTLKYFCQVINSLHFDKVIVRDAHSNVSLALLDRVIDLSPVGEIKEAIKRTEEYEGEIPILFFPDEGAMKRYSAPPINFPYAFGIKKRDWSTGKILGLQLINEEIVKERNVLIVDDICSRGGTFYHAANALKEAGAKNIYLYVTRDTRGYAIKATDCILGNDEIQIYKMPKTDPGKKSPRGCVAIFKEENGDYSLVENLTLEESIGYKNNVMKFKVKNGSFCTESVETIETIKERLMGEVL